MRRTLQLFVVLMLASIQSVWTFTRLQPRRLNAVNYSNNKGGYRTISSGFSNARVQTGQKEVSAPTLSRLQLSINPYIDSLASSILRYNGPVPLPQAFGINVALFTLLSSKLLKSLTPLGFFNAMALGTGLWYATGWRGWTVCVVYLVMGNIVTKVKFAEKEKRGLAEGRGGRRGPENVWGSAATGLACVLLTTQTKPFYGLSSNLLILGYVASIATKIADTFASEIGKAYGKTTFLITTLKRVPPGTEGAVSAEGTAASVVGGLILSLYAYSIGLISGPQVAVSTAAAFLATNVESVLGATIQDKKGLKWVTNEVINFLNTLIGAGIAISLAKYALGQR